MDDDTDTRSFRIDMPRVGPDVLNDSLTRTRFRGELPGVGRSRGGHFAVTETPDLLTGDGRDFFRPLR